MTICEYCQKEEERHLCPEFVNKLRAERDAALLQVRELEADKESQRRRAREAEERASSMDRLNDVLKAEVAQKDLCIKDLTSSERIRVPDLLKDLEDYSRGEITLSRLGEILSQSPAVLRAVFVRAANHMSGKDQQTEKRKCECVWLDGGIVGEYRDPKAPCAVHDKPGQPR